jgi:hypothetical protein
MSTRRSVAAASLAATGAVAAAAAASRYARASAPVDGEHPVAITVDRPLAEVAGGPDDAPPGPLAALGDAVEIRYAVAPGDRGTEIRAWVRPGETQVDRSAVRQALRETRQLIETGSVMPPDEPVTRRRTLVSTPLEAAIRHAGEGGRL